MKQLLLIFLVSGIQLHGQLLFKIEKDSVTSYAYSGGDEFNGGKLGEQWNDAPWPRVVMSQDLAFSPDKVSLKDGLIRFEALKKDSTYIMGDIEIDSSFLKRKKINLVKNQFYTKYSAGLILSKKKFHYGLYELRFKVEEGKGIWPAFWFYGGVKNEEIDAFELKGEKNNKIHVDTHCPHGCDNNYNGHKMFNKNWGGWLPISDYLHKGFNIMLLDWKADEVIWYINGYPLAYFKGSFPNPMNIYLNTSVAKDNEAFNPGPDATTPWPNNYYVDYLRIWNTGTQNSSSHLVLRANDSLTLSNAYKNRYDIHPSKKRGLNYSKKKLNKNSGIISLTLSSSGLLTLNKIGFAKKEKVTYAITGVESKRLYPTNINEYSETIKLDPVDKTLELKITTRSKIYSKLIDVKVN